MKKVINFETSKGRVFVPINNIEFIEIHELPATRSDEETKYLPVFILKNGKELREGTYHNKENLCKKIERLFETGEWLD